MILLDSSGWIEYFTKGPIARKIHQHIRSARTILVPTMVVFEVYRKITRSVSAEAALAVIGTLSTHQVVELTREIALHAADLSIENSIGMADSCILATAELHGAKLITLDQDFSKIPGVIVLRRDR